LLMEDEEPDYTFMKALVLHQDSDTLLSSNFSE